MANVVFAHQVRNNLSFLGLKENFVQEYPDYITVYDFERQDYLQLYFWLSNNTYRIYSLAIFYLVGIYILQKWMRSRAPFQLRKPLLFWNLLIAGLSIVMFSRILPDVVYVNKKYGFYRSYCKLDHVNSATLFWLLVFTFSKVFEFLDTAFIILRKQKLTFLHVFHHTSVFVSCVFVTTRSDPVAKYFALTNAFVHIPIYTYFALKAAQVKVPRKVAMCITFMELVQFICCGIINALGIYAKVVGTRPSCDRPRDNMVLLSVLTIAYLCLFGDFFVKSYCKKKIQ